MKTVKLVLAGLGTVGQAVARILDDESQNLARRCGLRFAITGALVRDRGKSRECSVPSDVITDDQSDLLSRPADMLVEMMGGSEAPRSIVLDALQSGRHVVTANKALLAEHGREIFAAARKADRCVAFEASCAGGVPIVGALLGGLASNHIHKITGILNGTCNFILTAMTDDGKTYTEALADAQRLGYAEADPSLDVCGFDAAHKLAILSALAFGCHVDHRCIAVQGIEGVQTTDLRIAGDLGYVCKLLAVGQRTGDKLMLTVYPMLVSAQHPMATVVDSTNAVSVYGDSVGHVMISGAGAGGPPTASAVVADMISVASSAANSTFRAFPVFDGSQSTGSYVDAEAIRCPYYVRFDAPPSDETERAVTDRLEHGGVPVEVVHPHHAAGAVVVLTGAVTESTMRGAAQSCCKSLGLSETAVLIRILTD